MAEILTPLAPDGGPLVQFALELRALRDAAPCNFRKLDEWEHPETGEVIHRNWDIDTLIDSNIWLKRSTVYAALSGKRMPKEHTLAALVEAWTDHLSKEEQLAAITVWREKRMTVLHELATMPRRAAPRTRKPVTAEQARLARELQILGGDPEETGISVVDQLRFAVAGMLSRGQIAEYLAGRVIPTDETLDEIFRQLHVPAADRRKIFDLAEAARQAKASATRVAPIQPTLPGSAP
jgi:transcriptional regulator with XRE-family HTH domain